MEIFIALTLVMSAVFMAAGVVLRYRELESQFMTPVVVEESPVPTL